MKVTNTHYKKLSVIRQKRKSQNRRYEKTNNGKFSEKQTFLTP